MFRRSLLLATLIGLAACAPQETVGHVGAPIIHGTRETGMPAVVAVLQTGGMGALCSGSAIGDYVVMTAKHCVFMDTSSGYVAVAPANLLVVVGSDLNTAGGVDHTVRVRDVRTTPGSNVDNDIMNGDDIALLMLDSAIGTPTLGTATGGPSTGQTVTLVGYGRTMPGTPDPTDSGVKYRGTAQVARVGLGLFETTGTSWTCQGDSGGPAIDPSGDVTGITSFGPSGCTTSNSYFTRVSRHAAMIASALTWRPPCTPSTEVCDGIDNDCNGVVDDGCTALGQPCTSDMECSNGRCDTVDGTQLCVRDCDPSYAIPRCPIGFTCESTGGCGMGRCIAGSPGSAPDGTECTADTDCVSLSCASVGGTMRCGRQCAPGGDLCPAGEVCETGGGSCGSCVPPEYATSPRPFGSVCDTNDQCQDGDCTGGVCTEPCPADGCPTSFHCRASRCVPGDLGGPGDRCTTSEDCGTAAPECVDAGGDMLCAAPCAADGTCALGMTCGTTSAGDRCVPPGAPLGATCSQNDECRSGICAGTCTILCDGGGPCPDGYECRMAGAHSGCFPPVTRASRGGCAVSADEGGGAGGALGFLLVACVALFLRRRRR